MYVSTVKAVEPGMCMYQLTPARTIFKAVEAGTCTYLGLFGSVHVPRYVQSV